MSNTPNDELIARHLLEAGFVTPEQLGAARMRAAEVLLEGRPITLAAVLAEMGIITVEMSTNVERQIRENVAGPRRVGPYTLISKLGEGGMGSVYLAEEHTSKRQVALKILPRTFEVDEESLSRFRREARSAARLHHENIVAALDSGESDGWHYYAMEYCDGETLGAKLKREGHLSPPEALRIIIQVAKGLRYAHDNGVVHRDIKPDNIFITANGVAKVLDLGLSKEIGNGDSTFNTQSGVTLGTPHYISPEQARGDKEIDGRTDIYSLGATLYHLVTGRTPFQAGSAAALLVKHLTEQIPNPQDVCEGIGDGIVQVIMKTMAKEPKHRYAYCADLLSDLELIAGGQAPLNANVESTQTTVALPTRAKNKRAALPHAREKKSSNGLLYIGLAAALITFVVVFVIAGQPQPSAVQNKMDPQPEMPGSIQQNPPPKQTQAPSIPAIPAKTTIVVPSNIDDPVRWAGSIDLLALIDADRDSFSGVWTKSEDGLMSDGGNTARLEIPYAPPEEYDFRITFVRKAGAMCVAQLLTSPQKPMAWLLGDHDNSSYTFTDGTNDYRHRIGALTVNNAIQNGKEHVSTVQVRKDHVATFFDGNLISSVEIREPRLIMAYWWKLRSPSLIGVGSHFSPTLFKKIELLEVTGKGRVTGHPKPAIKVGIAPGSFPFKGNHYKFFPSIGITQNDARRKCEQMGGHLARLDSKEEYEIVMGLLPEEPAHPVYIDGVYVGQTWQWSNSEPIKNFFWARNEPDNPGLEPSIAVERTRKDGGQGWVDISSGPNLYIRGFLCEWEADAKPAEK